MNGSTLIGTVLKVEPVLQYDIDGEKFYSILMSFNGTKLNVLYSEYTKVEITNGLLEVVGTLVSDCRQGVPKFYLYASSIKSAAPDAEQSSTLTVFGHVNRVGKVKITTGNRDQLPITLVTRWLFGGHSLIYTLLFDKLARRHQQLASGTPVQVTGNIEPYRDIVEIVVSDIIIKK